MNNIQIKTHKKLIELIASYSEDSAAANDYVSKFSDAIEYHFNIWLIAVFFAVYGSY